MRRHAILAQRTVTEGTGSYGEKKSAGGACNRGGVIHSDRLRLRSNPQAVLLFARSRSHQPGNWCPHITPPPTISRGSGSPAVRTTTTWVTQERSGGRTP